MLSASARWRERDGVKRTTLLVLAVVALPLVGFGPVADATGAAACTISGTMTFTAASVEASQGAWAIDPAVISCQGLYNGYERILGPGAFSGAGTYTAFPAAGGSCLHHIGVGTVDYTVLTSASDVHLVEPHAYTLLGPTGTFESPSLRGSFQVMAPYDGDCVTKPVTKALFVAQAVLTRFYPEDPTNRLPKPHS
jgi:hypothetical protein